jgi:CRP-like cAMP-binding protein
MGTLLVTPTADLAKENQILAALPAEDFARIAPFLNRVAMPVGELLYEPGSILRSVYFPTTAVVSLHYVLESGASAESAGVGFEGLVGVSLFMGGETTPSSAAVQIAGHGYSLDAALLKREFGRSGAVQILLLRYTQALIAQMTQTAACNRHHSVEQQICRWLLMTLDRVPCGEIVVTQEMIAGVLGVRRESVTEVAGALQRAGVIRYRRGHISVLERAGLISSVCECYSVVKRQMQRLLPQAPGYAPQAEADRSRSAGLIHPARAAPASARSDTPQRSD